MIKLNSLLPDHLSAMFRIRNDERVFKWCRQNDLLDWDNHKVWFEKQAKDPKIKMFSIINDEYTFIGVCGLTDIDLLNQRAEFSLYIDPNYHSKGYGKKALIDLLKIGFQRYPLKTIYGETFNGNPAIKMFEDIGFTKEGTRRNFYFRDGKHTDAHLYSITKDEYGIRYINNISLTNSKHTISYETCENKWIFTGKEWVDIRGPTAKINI